MNKEYRLIIFDWEGTLGDPYGFVSQFFIKEAKNYNYPLDIINLRKSLQYGLVKALPLIFPQFSPSEVEDFLLRLRSYLNEHKNKTYLIPGAKETVKAIFNAGIKLAIATNKSARSLDLDLEESGLTPYFVITRSAGETLPKPHPQMLLEILTQLDLNANEALMIGDSESDMAMAKSIDMDCIGVCFYNEQNLLLNAGALQVFDDYEKVRQFLNLKLKSNYV